MVKFSIIIPVYNVAPYLHECLRSVVAASDKLRMMSDKWAIEIICVDDGSTDRSGEILADFEVKVRGEGEGSRKGLMFKVVHQQNLGVSAARNRGLEMATGGWIAFVDGDDAVTPNWLVTAAGYLDRNEIDLLRMDFQVWGGGAFEPPQGDDFRLIERVELAVWAWQTYLSYRCGGPWLNFIRRRILGDDVRMPVGMAMKEDRIFCLKAVAQAKRIASVNYPGYLYRQRAGSACTSRVLAHSTRYLKELLAEFENERERFPDAPSMARVAASVSQSVSWDLLESMELLTDVSELGDPGFVGLLRQFKARGLLRLRYVRWRVRFGLWPLLAFGSTFGFVAVRRMTCLVRRLGYHRLKGRVRSK